MGRDDEPVGRNDEPVGRDDGPVRPGDAADRERRIAAILARGRQTRKPPPRWLWIAAALVAVICATGLVSIALGLGRGDAPPSQDQRLDHSSRKRP